MYVLACTIAHMCLRCLHTHVHMVNEQENNSFLLYGKTLTPSLRQPLRQPYGNTTPTEWPRGPKWEHINKHRTQRKRST